MSQWGEVAVSFEVTRESLSGKRHSRRDLKRKPCKYLGTSIPGRTVASASLRQVLF